MRENIKNFTFCLFCVGCIVFIFLNNTEVAFIITSAINLFFKKVFVSLFPMFIINDILISANLPFYFYKMFNSLFKKVFKTGGISAYVFIMSLISGTPSNAYILKSLVEEKKVSPEEASHYLYFTYFSNPLFLVMMLGGIFGAKVTAKLIIIHYVSNVLVGILVRKNAPSITNYEIESQITRKENVLINSINRSISTLLMILGTIVFYMLVSYIIINCLNIRGIKEVIVTGFLEITNGLNNLGGIKEMIKVKELLASLIISFGGLSINTQIKAILEDSPINYVCFLKGRIMQTIIASSLTLIL